MIPRAKGDADSRSDSNTGTHQADPARPDDHQYQLDHAATHGVALGRELWDLFARAIYAVPEPTVPIRPVLLIVLGTLVLANIAAAIPGRIAARTPAAGLRRGQ